MRRESVLVEELVEHLRRRGETVSFAESCTGGLLSATTAAIAGVSDVYMGSIVAYSNAVKTKILGVPDAQLRSIGAVSLPVARAMAQGARKVLGTSWSVSITGIAGPGGGSPQKPVGTVCFGINGPGVDRAEQALFTGGRHVIQQASVDYALRILITELGGTESRS